MSMTNPIDTAALRRAREETTQGEWAVRDTIDGPLRSTDIRCVEPNRMIARCAPALGRPHVAECEANARFIALAHREWPALLDRIDALEAENARLRGALAGIANRINIEGSPWHDAQVALDKIVVAVKREARTALGDPS